MAFLWWQQDLSFWLVGIWLSPGMFKLQILFSTYRSLVIILSWFLWILLVSAIEIVNSILGILGFTFLTYSICNHWSVEMYFSHFLYNCVWFLFEPPFLLWGGVSNSHRKTEVILSIKQFTHFKFIFLCLSGRYWVNSVLENAVNSKLKQSEFFTCSWVIFFPSAFLKCRKPTL